MKKSDRPDQHFIGAILRGFDRAEGEGKPVTCSKIWDYVVMECLQRHDGFKTMFAWDTSTAQSKNRIQDIMECVERGHVSGLRLRLEPMGRGIFVERC